MYVRLRPACRDDGAALAAIYNHYIANTICTFETEPVAAADMAQRAGETQAAGLPWLVATENGRVAGYACASKWKGRCAYRYSVESTVYLAPDAIGKGTGSSLYTVLIEALRASSLHAVIGGIALPNEPSVRLHERLGFKKVAHFSEVGHKFERWIDVGYWQLML